MAALTVYLSASPADAEFAGRLNRAIVAAGGNVVSTPPTPTPAGDATGDTTAQTEPLPQGEQQTLDSARAYVAVLSPAALGSNRLQSEAAQYTGASRGDAKRIIVPVQLEPLPPDASVPTLQPYKPVTGPYGDADLQDVLIKETLRRLGLPARSNWWLVALVAALLLLVCCALVGTQTFAPGGRFHFIIGGVANIPASATSTPTAPPTATPRAAGGLLGQYYRSSSADMGTPIPSDPFGQLLFSRVDPELNFHEKQGQYPDPRLAGGPYAIRWTGQVKPAYSETYTFVTDSDDGTRVWVNGQLLIDNWTVHADEQGRATIALTAGQFYDIKVEYYENDISDAVMKLQWQSASQPLQVVPSSALYPAAQ
jgi:hypothetical protein